jgi:methylenetetrahydrofolate/methylenetetrahydromethanopterin dehydrogenase (NADP+)
MSKSKILIQLDPDPQVSTFDSVVAIDAGVDQLFRHAGVTVENVQSLVHGAMFTRGGEDLKSTALFVGGSDVEVAKSILNQIVRTFFGPVRVSVMADPNGANTTAAAAVLSAEKHIGWNRKQVAILGATGSVGQRIAQILGTNAQQSGNPIRIRIVSRTLEKAEEVCQRLKSQCGDHFEPFQAENTDANLTVVQGADVIFSAGAAGVNLLPADWRERDQAPEVAIDLNAVPPSGISGIDALDRGKQKGSTICYGAIGVGGLKMKIHKRCLNALFESNDKILDVQEIYQIGKQLADQTQA